MRFCRDNKIFFFVPVAVTLRNIGGGGGGGGAGAGGGGRIRLPPFVPGNLSLLNFFCLKVCPIFRLICSLLQYFHS